jgi:hypothetical protein
VDQSEGAFAGAVVKHKHKRQVIEKMAENVPGMNESQLRQLIKSCGYASEDCTGLSKLRKRATKVVQAILQSDNMAQLEKQRHRIAATMKPPVPGTHSSDDVVDHSRFGKQNMQALNEVLTDFLVHLTSEKYKMHRDSLNPQKDDDGRPKSEHDRRDDGLELTIIDILNSNLCGSSGTYASKRTESAVACAEEIVDIARKAAMFSYIACARFHHMILFCEVAGSAENLSILEMNAALAERGSSVHVAAVTSFKLANELHTQHRNYDRAIPLYFTGLEMTGRILAGAGGDTDNADDRTRFGAWCMRFQLGVALSQCSRSDEARSEFENLVLEIEPDVLATSPRTELQQYCLRDDAPKKIVRIFAQLLENQRRSLQRLESQRVDVAWSSLPRDERPSSDDGAVDRVLHKLVAVQEWLKDPSADKTAVLLKLRERDKADAKAHFDALMTNTPGTTSDGSPAGVASTVNPEEDRFDISCVACGTESSTLHHCSKCRLVKYCNQTCQRAHYKPQIEVFVSAHLT